MRILRQNTCARIESFLIFLIFFWHLGILAIITIILFASYIAVHSFIYLSFFNLHSLFLSPKKLKIKKI